MWEEFYQDKIIIPENDVSQYDSYMDSDGEDDLFHGLLNTRTIRADPDVEVVDEYAKYITKDQDMRMFKTLFSGGETISQPTLILLKWHLTFLQFQQ